MKLFNNLNFNKLKEGLSKTRNKLVNNITETFTGKAVIDENTLNELEEILISSDLSVELSGKIITNLKTHLKGEKDRTLTNILDLLKNELMQILKTDEDSTETKNNKENVSPYVILIVGVNGVGKTTTIGKLAHNFNQAGNKVIVGAADTFRVAANEQLDIWAKRAGVEIIQQNKGTDPSSVAFDAVRKAVDGKYDVVIIDTAGRLHSKVNLMNELIKIKRAIEKVLPGAPHDTYLVLDANVGQNALIQADEFAKVIQTTGLILTKLDGTAKGGTIFQICEKHNVPVKFIGVGEKINDLQTFEPKLFVDALFNNNENQ
ncbi:MAG: signal recognition particle-docking protein FtsY [Ignavibacteriaceae bacterium]|jgi:fused signal recognition particle receptor|nr:signal recognition particle-docking protein FtsY [Ignavibacteriaceae bacterium]MCW8813180.1 signal recognition particle-docking protein FtsY [Chlorobium sp.]MCW8817230.1 signal recognition particle-docking protein FtsY [Ignavibacteriaceae bacterium]MCW8823566.1 signal recognition particle-docking protein FtsY [Ignavibacteriaceae bacterium]MCW9098586.1 signal recognition particle-docking protein FtsY [Ignavibacteriaceae bacterium]